MAPLHLVLGSFPETLSVNPVEYFALGATGQPASVSLEEVYLKLFV